MKNSLLGFNDKREADSDPRILDFKKEAPKSSWESQDLFKELFLKRDERF